MNETLRYQNRKVFNEVLRHRLRELAGACAIRVSVDGAAATEAWHVNAKRIYRCTERKS